MKKAVMVGGLGVSVLLTVPMLVEAQGDKVQVQTRGDDSQSDSGQAGDETGLQQQQEAKGPADTGTTGVTNTGTTTVEEALEVGVPAGQQVGDQTGTGTGDSHNGEIVQNKVQAVNQVMQQYKGEVEEQTGSGTQAQVKTQVQTQTKTMTQTQEKTMALVAKQESAQKRIEAALTQVEERSGLMKSLLGPDYKAVKQLKQQVAANQVQIKEMNQVLSQVQNKAEETQLENMVQVMEEQNLALQEKIKAEEQTKSLFGWLIKWMEGEE